MSSNTERFCLKNALSRVTWIFKKEEKNGKIQWLTINGQPRG